MSEEEHPRELLLCQHLMMACWTSSRACSSYDLIEFRRLSLSACAMSALATRPAVCVPCRAQRRRARIVTAASLHVGPEKAHARVRSALVAGMACLLLGSDCAVVASPAQASEELESSLSLSSQDAASPLVQRLLTKSAQNKSANDAERKDYSKQYGRRVAAPHDRQVPLSSDAPLRSHSYFQVLKATSSYVPSSDEDRAKLGYSKPAECLLPFFQASDLCRAFENRQAQP